MTDYQIALAYLSKLYPKEFDGDVSAVAEFIWSTQQLDPEQVVDACFDYFSESGE